MIYTQDIYSGPKSLANLARFMTQAHQAAELLKSTLDKGDLPAFTICRDQTDLDGLKPTVQRYRQFFKKIVVLGTGGSSLGGQTLNALAGVGLSTVTPQIIYIDNIDPKTFEELLTSSDPTTTGYIVISKSGETAETLMQLLVVASFYQKQGQNISQHFTVITEEKDSSLMRLAKMWALPVLPHHPKIGGRFSVFSNVGMLPALMAGLDVEGLRQGAQTVLDTLVDAQSAPIKGAALAVALMSEGITSTVIMPYQDRLAFFGLWYRQLWAESLGKNGQGTTPIRAMGTVDQHSQLQLYLDGPQDKTFTFLIQKSNQSPLKAPQIEDPALAYLSDRSMGDLLYAEAKATVATLKDKGCPVQVLSFETLDTQTMGALLMHFMIETVLVAQMLGINAYDQPAVEHVKMLTKQFMLSGL